jgi:fructokinase
MIAGAPEGARWIRAAPRRELPVAQLERLVHTVFPGCRVLNVKLLTDGLRNANFKLRLSVAPELIVLRIYAHDPSICQKEVDLIRLIGASVPVAEVIHAEPLGWEDIFPPLMLTRYTEGITFRELARSAYREAVAQAEYSTGETLAAIGRTTFSKPGWLGPGPSVAGSLTEGADPVPRFIDLCLASPNLQQRMDAELRGRTAALVWSWAPEIAALDQDARLVHGDFGKRNVLVRNVAGTWQVAAVVDWEFAVSGCPLADRGHFLRYERATRPLAEPHFSNGYRNAGGKLPNDWRQLAQLLDLTGLCESLTHDELPDDVVGELVELVRAIVELPERRTAY